MRGNSGRKWERKTSKFINLFCFLSLSLLSKQIALLLSLSHEKSKREMKNDWTFIKQKAEIEADILMGDLQSENIFHIIYKKSDRNEWIFLGCVWIINDGIMKNVPKFISLSLINRRTAKKGGKREKFICVIMKWSV